VFTSWTNGEAGAVTLGLQPALSRVGFLRKSDNLSDVDWCALSTVVWRKRTQFATVADRPIPAARQGQLPGSTELAYTAKAQVGGKLAQVGSV
jgi:hypothetical protein